MSRSLLDTDIFSEVLKRFDERVVQRATAYRAEYGYFTTSVTSVMEIVRGLHKTESEQRIRLFVQGLAQVEVLALDAGSAITAGRIIADLERTGQAIGVADSQIAAIALHHGVTLVTGNQAHYERIRALGYGLRLDTWRA